MRQAVLERGFFTFNILNKLIPILLMERTRSFHTEIWIKTVHVLHIPLEVFHKKKVEKSHGAQENISSIAHCIWRLTKKTVSESRTRPLENSRVGGSSAFTGARTSQELLMERAVQPDIELDTETV